jgi:hypothetical protein
MADRLGVETIDREGRLVVIKFRPTAKVDPVRLVKVVSEWPGATLVPPVSLKLDLEAPAVKTSATAGSARGGGQPPAAVGGRRDGPAGRRPSGLRSGSRPDSGASWWTARATAGEVKAGFTKEEMLRKPEADPRAEGGMFARLEGLLRAMG